MKRITRYWETILVGAVILYGCLIREPHVQLPQVTNADKWVHCAMYLLLSMALCWDLHRDRQTNLRLWLPATLVPIALGGAIELLQKYFFYPRTAEWGDWGADILGTIIGCAIMYGVIHYVNRRADK